VAAAVQAAAKGDNVADLLSAVDEDDEDEGEGEGEDESRAAGGTDGTS